MQNNTISNFRYDINALRAIAVLGVIFFHYKVNLIAGGFSGVDVFFVISGYLMSRIIINSIDKNKFSYTDFIGKRLKRIVPALLVLVFALMVISFFFYFPEDYKTNQKNAAGTVLFLSNFWYWKHSNYFDTSSDTNILLHTWSLSVEWQFYLLYPIILLIINRLVKKRKTFIYLFIGSTIALLFISIITTLRSPTASFYLLPTRAWEMMFGGIAFFCEDLLSNTKWRKQLAIVGYIAILACFLLLRSYMLWPGVYTILPVFATFLVIIANYNDFKFIRFEGVQFLGRISYSLYLWHWPAIVFAQYLGIELNTTSITLLIAISVILALISYTYIESKKIESSWLIVSVGAAILVCTVILSLFDLNAFLLKPTTLKIAQYRETHTKEMDKQFNTGNCFVNYDGKEAYNKEGCLIFVKDKKNILLLGDSHGGELSESLRDSLNKRNINLLQATASGGIPSVKLNGFPKFRQVMAYVFQDFIPNSSTRVDGVIISAHWMLYPSRVGGNKEEFLSFINETVNYFNKYKIKVIIIGQSEAYTIPYPTIAAREYQLGYAQSYKYFDKEAVNMNNLLLSRFKNYYVDILNNDPHHPLSSDNTPYMSDKNHYTKYGADIVIHKILSDPMVKGFLN